MRVRLLHPAVDQELSSLLPWQINAFIDDDLELGRLYTAMAAGDTYLRETVRKVVVFTVTDPEVITYRQRVLADCLAHPGVVRQMYDIASEVDGIELRHKVFLGGLQSRDPELILRRSVRILDLLTASLRQLRRVSDENAGRFRSTGFQQLSTMLAEQLSDEYLAQIDDYLGELNMPRGLLLSAGLGLGNTSDRHLLHQPGHRSWWAKLTGNQHEGFGFAIDNDDFDGVQALTGLAGRAVNDVANTVTQAAEHFQAFFARLRMELGFYRGCLNLHAELVERQVPVCFPAPAPVDTPRFRCRGLRDVGLGLTTAKTLTGNDVDADGKTLIVVTGANEGGKSTFLRSFGAAQLMMQAGMFVAAESFSANVRDGVFTHFKREEDATLRHGKLEEELARMNGLVEYIKPTSLLLCNESFASTNELEGSEIARGIVAAMVESGVRVVFVTHLYDLARGLYARQDPADLFLRAERRPDGARTFRVIPGEPEPTSYGEDSFRRIFGGPAAALQASRGDPDEIVKP